MLQATTKKQIDELIEASRNYQNAYELVHYGEVMGYTLSECMLPDELLVLAKLVGVPIRATKTQYGTKYEVIYKDCHFYWFEKHEKEVA